MKEISIFVSVAVGVYAVVVIGVFGTAWLFNRNNDVVVLKRSDLIRCNNTVFADKHLGEVAGQYWWSDNADKSVSDLYDKANFLDAQNKKTNAEVNRLRALIGCYFDNK